MKRIYYDEIIATVINNTEHNKSENESDGNQNRKFSHAEVKFAL